jgi:hypothetical protein
MPSNADRQNIIKVTRNLFFKGVDLGFIKPNSQKVRVNGQIQTAEVDQIAATVAKAVLNGFAPELEVTLMRTDIDFVAGVLLQGMTGYRYGTNGPLYGFGNPEIDMDLLAGELLSIPKNNQPGVRTNSIRFGLAYPSPDTIELMMGKGQFQEIPLKFVVLPDLEEDIWFQMMQMGNLDAEGLAPLAVVLQTATPFMKGAKSLTAMTLGVGEQQQIQAYRLDGVPSGVVADLGANITATDTTVPYVNASQNNPFVKGQLVRIGGASGELALVDAVTPTTLQAGTLTLIRGAYKNNNASHTSGDEIMIMKNVYRVNITQIANFTSDQPTRVKVGNVPGNLGIDQKGVISHAGTAGAAVIKATVQGVDSPNFTVTAA